MGADWGQWVKRVDLKWVVGPFRLGVSLGLEHNVM